MLDYVYPRFLDCRSKGDSVIVCYILGLLILLIAFSFSVKDNGSSADVAVRWNTAGG